MTVKIDEDERTLSLILNVSAPNREIPKNEELWVENCVQEYINDEYGIWYEPTGIVVQDTGRSHFNKNVKTFRVAVID